MAATTSKKRKVGENESPRQVSAFAAFAARNRQVQQDLNLVSTTHGKISPNHLNRQESSKTPKKPEEHVEDSVVVNEQPSTVPQSILQLSTIRPNQIKKCSETSVKVLLEPGDRLVALGQYDLEVCKGHVTILGASLYASSAKYHVDAPSSHCLPVIRCDGMEIEAAEITLSQSKRGLERLDQVSPLFRGVWSDSPSFSENEEGDIAADSDPRSLDMGSFHILYSTVTTSSKSLLRPMISPPEWNALLSTLQSPDSQKTPIVLVCGPKSAGKSTFSKLLINRILTSREATKIPSNKQGLILLDCDPGQPEYSPPGQLSLTLLKDLNFGPPFSHPTTSGTRNHLIRAHSIAAVTPANDPELYMSCVLDLFHNYHARYSQHPLVINTPGWILGTGLEILVDLVQTVNPTAVVYMSQEGPLEVIESLKEAAKSIPLYTLPSQGNEFAIRNSSDLRAMQTMSYFHLQQKSTTNDLRWDPTPLSSIPPTQIRYTGTSSGILGILCLGDQPPPELLAEAINGSVLAIVVIDDIHAIPNQKSTPPNHHPNDLETSDPNSLILRTPKEQLPYFNPQKSITLSPTHSHTIGNLLIRAIDTTHHRLQILTPIPLERFQDIQKSGNSIVLVNGRLDNPGWAYTEELFSGGGIYREGRVQGGFIGDGLSGQGFAKVDVPWVEELRGGKGRGEGGRVWKVRRDLGRRGGES